MMPVWANKAMVLCDKYDLPAMLPGDPPEVWQPKMFDLLYWMDKRIEELEAAK